MFTSEEVAKTIETSISNVIYWRRKYQGYIETVGFGGKKRITEKGQEQLKLIAELSTHGTGYLNIITALREEYPFDSMEDTPISTAKPTLNSINELIVGSVLPDIARLQTSLDMILNKLDISEETAEPVEDVQETTQEEAVISPEKLLKIMLDIKSQFPKSSDAPKRIDAMNETGIPANKKDGIWTVKNFGDKLRYLEKTLK